MSESVYITDPVVAAAYHVPQGSFVSIADTGEAAWLTTTQHAYPLTYPKAFPAAGYVNPSAPPFVPWEGTPPGTTPAQMKFTISEKQPGMFEVMFGNGTDSVDATADFTVYSSVPSPLAHVNYTQPAGTSRQNAASLLYAALQSYGTLVLVKNGAAVDISGNTGVTVGAVEGDLSIPSLARAPRRGRAAS
jgi:hypothetical protein